MQLSLNWLKEYVPLTVSPEEFAEAMTLSGSKVETFGRVSDDINNVVIGKVTDLRRHENSDKLMICQVDIGGIDGKPIQIVTAAPNVRLGAYVPVVLIGGSVYNTHGHGGDRIMKIKKSKLGGYASDGMMCGYDELGLDLSDVPYADPEGLLLLNDNPAFAEADVVLGMPALAYFGKDDVAVEFEITNNRPDCLSVLGLAAEASATFNVPYTPPFGVSKGGTACADTADAVGVAVLPPWFSGHNIVTNAAGTTVAAVPDLHVQIDNTRLCSRYAAAVVKNVRIAPSPKWLADRLQASGVRAINNFVDITNYVMLEYGHPLHAFDKRYVSGDSIVVRSAKDFESITLLDGNTVRLDGDMLVIADAKSPVAIAGVMGGEYSGIMDDTLDVVFEAACFDGVSTRLSAKKAGRRTDASARFEKGLNPLNALEPLIRALDLVKKLDCGDVCADIIDVRNFAPAPVTLPLDCERIRRYLGADIPDTEQFAILRRLGFVVNGGDANTTAKSGATTTDNATTASGTHDQIACGATTGANADDNAIAASGTHDQIACGATTTVTVPQTRIDIHNTYDLAEEIARIYGYNNIPSTLPRVQHGRIRSGGANALRERVKSGIIDVLTGDGFYEALTYGFTSEKLLTKAGYNGERVRILNPFGEDTAVMRVAVLPSLLAAAASNIADKNNEGRLFEIGRAYLPDGGNALPLESERAAAVSFGKDCDFYDIKGTVEELFAAIPCGEHGVTYAACSDNPLYHPGRCAAVSCCDAVLGYVGEIHPRILERFGIRGKACGFELLLDGICEHAEGLAKLSKLKVRPLPRYPAVTRDLSLVCDNAVTCGEILDVIRAKGKNLESAEFFDLYDLGEGRKSLSFKLTLRKADGTLTDNDADSAVKRVLNALSQKGVELRQ